MYVTDKLTDKNNMSEKILSVIYGMLVSLSIINILIDLQKNKVR